MKGKEKIKMVEFNSMEVSLECDEEVTMKVYNFIKFIKIQLNNPKCYQSQIQELFAGWQEAKRHPNEGRYISIINAYNSHPSNVWIIKGDELEMHIRLFRFDRLEFYIIKDCDFEYLERLGCFDECERKNNIV